MSAIPKMAWRVIGDLPGDEFFIPFAGPRGRAALAKLLSPPDPAEVERRQRLALEREVARVAELDGYIARHTDVVVVHQSNDLVSAILSAHAPHELAAQPAQRWLECHGCPTGYDNDGGTGYYQSWPCPTWTQISEWPR